MIRTRVGKDKDGNVTSITTEHTEQKEIDGKLVDVIVVKTYSFTYTTTTKETTTEGHKIDSGELGTDGEYWHWNNPEDESKVGYWEFEKTGDSFAVKQSGYVVIWYDATKYDTEAKREDLKDYFVGLDNNGGSLDGKSFAFTTSNDFILKNYFNVNGGNLNARVTVENGVIKVYGKGKMSHFLMGTGTTTSTTTSMDNEYKWEANGWQDKVHTAMGNASEVLHSKVSDPALIGMDVGVEFDGGL